jgi:MFS family permease
VSDSPSAPVASVATDPHLRRNFALGLLNGAMFNFAEALMSVDTVLTWFVQRLGGSNFLIGLVGPMRDAGWFLPQLFVSHRLQREPLKMPIYRRMMVVRAVAWFIWTAAAIVLAANFPALLAVFFVAYGVNALASGFSGLSFMDIVAKTIPARRRGTYFGGRMFIGSLLGLAASGLVGVMVAENNPTPFPLNVAALFIIAWVAALIGLFSFALVKEPDGEVRDEDDTLTSHVRRAARLPRQNENLRYLLIARVVILLSYIAAPFYSIYSINVLHAPVSILGVYVGVRMIVSLVIYPVWSRLSDRRGNKLVMQLATACGVVMLAWALFAPIVAESVRADASVIAYLFVPVFALMGLYETGVGIGAVNLLLEIAPGNDRAIYVGLTNTVLGVAYFSTIASGLLVDAVGYRGVFALALALLLTGLWALSRLQEPRDLARLTVSVVPVLDLDLEPVEE